KGEADQKQNCYQPLNESKDQKKELRNVKLERICFAHGHRVNIKNSEVTTTSLNMGIRMRDAHPKTLDRRDAGLAGPSRDGRQAPNGYPGWRYPYIALPL